MTEPEARAFINSIYVAFLGRPATGADFWIKEAQKSDRVTILLRFLEAAQPEILRERNRVSNAISDLKSRVSQLEAVDRTPVKVVQDVDLDVVIGEIINRLES